MAPPHSGASTSISMTADTDAVTTFLQIDCVKVLILLTFPVRIQIVVHGKKVLGVDVDVKQERKDKEVIVTMTQTYSHRIQSTVVPFTQHLFLQGAVETGLYLLRVNNYSTTFERK